MKNRIKMKNKRKRYEKIISLAVLFSLLILAAVGAAAWGGPEGNIPLNLEEIPVFSGAERDYEAEEEYADQNEGWSEDVVDRTRSDITRIYSVNTAPEAVAKFYIAELKASEGWPEMEPGPPVPGTLVDPWYEIELYDQYAFEDQYEYDSLIYDGKWVKSCLSGRETWENGEGEWLTAARVEWNAVLENGDLAQYSVGITDESFDMYNRVYEQQTHITINVYIEKSEEAYEDEMFEEMDREVESSSLDLMNNPPDEETLGVPIYPGAVFDAISSAGMSMDGYQMYIYLSADPLEEVIDFYEEQLNKEAAAGGMGYLIPLSGELPVPDEAVAIQPNMFGGDARTMITIQKCSE